MLAPLTYRFWQRYGFVSFWIFAAGAAATDLAFFAADMRWLAGPITCGYGWRCTTWVLHGAMDAWVSRCCCFVIPRSAL